MKKVKIKIGFFAFMLLLALVASKSQYTFISLIAAAIHELGHICAAKILKITLTEFDFGLLGARLKISGGFYSYKQEMALAFGGPLFNFLSAALLLSLKAMLSISHFALETFILSSLALGILNLLPIHTFDGGRIFESALLNFLPPSAVKFIMDILSFLSVFSLWSISVYFLLIYSYSLNLFIFSLSLFSHLFLESQQ